MEIPGPGENNQACGTKAWQAVKRDHARLIRAAGTERFVLDRLCVNDDAPFSSSQGQEPEDVGVKIDVAVNTATRWTKATFGDP